MSELHAIAFPAANGSAEVHPVGIHRPIEGAPNDGDLSRRMAKGDIAALETLLERYWQTLVRYTYRILGDVAAAEDVVQEAFVRIWNSREGMAGRPIRASLYRASRNLALDELRRLSARTRRETQHLRIDADPPATPAEVLEHERLGAAMNAAIQALPERRREAFTLVYLRALSYAEVAELMEISEKTVGNHISAALAELRGTLKPLLATIDIDAD